MSVLDILKSLLPLYGPSGREQAVADAIEAMIKPYTDEVRRDAMGNLIALKRGGGRRVMLAAHMDQIGLMATHIDKDGFLRVTPVGGVRPQWQLFQSVRFQNGTLGVLGYETKTVDSMEKLKPEHLFIDIGARTREEAEERVKIGDMAVFESRFTQCGGRASCGALDDRAACAALIEALRRIEKSPYDIYAVFTSQEEVGARGAQTAAYAIQPELALAIDATPSPDTPEAQLTCSARLGRGPAVKVRDASLISHPRVRRWLEDAAKAGNIPYQLEVLTAGGTDAGAMQQSREGVPSGVLSIPTRYVHSPAEMMDLADFEQTIELLVKALTIEA
jgi:putative aminopeptidase FrvX